jgi:predicted dehydrogenase
LSRQPRKVRTAVIGLGWPGIQHLKGYIGHGESEVVAVCDLDEKRCKTVAAEYSIPHTFTDHRKMLESREIDAVSVCLPNFLHAPISIDVLNAKKHVLCEKPPACSAKEAEGMAKAAEKNRRTLMYAVVQRFGGNAQFLKKMIDAGELGDIYFGKAGYVRRRGMPVGREAWFVDKSRSGGGALIDIGVHALDCIWWLMGNPNPVAVMGAAYSKFGHLAPQKVKYNVDDATFAQIRFEDGATIMLEATWVLNLPGGGYVQIAGTKAGAKLNPLTIYTEEDGKEVDKTPEVATVNSFDEETKHFVDCIRDGREPIASARQGVTLMRMLDAIYQSSEKKREVLL